MVHGLQQSRMGDAYFWIVCNILNVSNFWVLHCRGAQHRVGRRMRHLRQPCRARALLEATKEGCQAAPPPMQRAPATQLLRERCSACSLIVRLRRIVHGQLHWQITVSKEVLIGQAHSSMTCEPACRVSTASAMGRWAHGWPSLHQSPLPARLATGSPFPTTQPSWSSARRCACPEPVRDQHALLAIPFLRPQRLQSWSQLVDQLASCKHHTFWQS